VKPLVILVTGSRDYTDRAFVYAALGRAREFYSDRRIIVRHGLAKGADTLASDWVQSIGNHRLVDEDPHDPNDHGPWPAAGMIRNAHMIRLEPRPDWCLGFVNRCRRPQCKNRQLHGSHGAEGCLEMAERAQIPFKAWRTF
jgi:hypothetical protein